MTGPRHIMTPKGSVGFKNTWVSAPVSPELKKKAKEVARMYEISLAELVRRALIQYIEYDQDQP